MEISRQLELEMHLGLLCSIFSDIEKIRIGVGNRVGQALRDEPDKDGRIRGFMLDEEHPAVVKLLIARDGMHNIEEALEKEIVSLMKQHPLGPWVESRKGCGHKTIGRLIGCIGDPYLRVTVSQDGVITQSPRSLRQCWALCGMSVLPDGTTPARRKGEKASWNVNARRALFIISRSQVYGRDNYYRPLYDEEKEHYLKTPHALACKRCGPSGKPAPPGSERSKGHADANALRKVSQQVIKDLWRESRKLHGITEANEDGFTSYADMP